MQDTVVHGETEGFTSPVIADMEGGPDPVHGGGIRTADCIAFLNLQSRRKQRNRSSGRKMVWFLTDSELT